MTGHNGVASHSHACCPSICRNILPLRPDAVSSGLIGALLFFYILYPAGAP
jgi:hypothetical protein